MVAPKGRDPLLQSTDEQVKNLQVAYHKLMSKLFRKPPFFITQNLRVIHNLCTDQGKRQVETFFDANTPTSVMVGLIDALERTDEAASEYILWFELAEGSRRSKVKATEKELLLANERTEKVGFFSEKFYQCVQDIHHAIRFQLDWKNDRRTIDTALRGILPKGTGVAPLTTHISPHGLAAFDQIGLSMSEEERKSVAILSGAYFETPDIFEGVETKENVEDKGLRHKRVIIMEPHPNNAKTAKIVPHDPLKLLETLYGEDTGPHTVIMDVTLNHLGESQIAAVLKMAQPFIDNGKLNLIFVQSGTKFLQHGMDLVNIGLSMVFNDGKSWGEFNNHMAKHEELVPEQDKHYIANMLTTNQEELGAYLAKIRENTLYLSLQLQKALSQSDNAFDMNINEDKETVYLAIKPKDEFVLAVGHKDATEESRKDVNQKIYKNHLLPALRSLPIVNRESFGFNITNLGECITTIRLTLGIEEEGLLDRYCEEITLLGQDLWAHPEKLQ
jgi:hypothetical protein